MKSRPILFSGAMVRALLDGSKTQTRRAVKGRALEWLQTTIGFTPEFVGDPANSLCPYGQPGDQLWVREAWYCDDYNVQRGPYLKPADMDVLAAREDGTLVYAADGLKPYEAEQPIWKPSIHMPRWASRITLEITGVFVERLQDISEADAIAEGIFRFEYAGQVSWSDYSLTDEWAAVSPMLQSPIESYRTLWQSINGPGSWAANPWAWVVEFKKLEAA